MSDESGGDFGGGSVSWKIRYPENSDKWDDGPSGGKKATRGKDSLSGATHFWIVLTNKKPNGQTIEDDGGNTLKDKLQSALNILNDDNPKTITVKLPIVPGLATQIRVLWEEPH